MLKVNETRRRSLLKAVSFRLIEIAASTGILSFFVEVETAFGLAVTIECLCLGLHYIFERIWNKSQWGRCIEE